MAKRDAIRISDRGLSIRDSSGDRLSLKHRLCIVKNRLHYPPLFIRPISEWDKRKLYHALFSFKRLIIDFLSTVGFNDPRVS